MALSGDEDVVEAFPAQCSDEAFHDRVRPRRPDRGADDPDIGTGEDRVERGGELTIPVTDQEPEPIGSITEIHQQVAGLLGDPGPVGWAVIPAMCTRRRPRSITTRT
jgi:hypothetical protein